MEITYLDIAVLLVLAFLFFAACRFIYWMIDEWDERDD